MMIQAVPETAKGTAIHTSITQTPKASPGTEIGSSTTYSSRRRPGRRVRDTTQETASPSAVANVAAAVEISTLVFMVDQTSSESSAARRLSKLYCPAQV